MDDEVQRLRKLRLAALQLRALARVCGAAGKGRDEWLHRRTSAAAWRVARCVTGQLNAHPYHPYRRPPTPAECALLSVAAHWAALRCRSPARVERAVSSQIRILKRLVDDNRAVTRCAELSDALGRAQVQIGSLAAEWLGTAARRDTRAGVVDGAVAAPQASPVSMAERPYLGF
jgi:hypothetical protein